MEVKGGKKKGWRLSWVEGSKAEEEKKEKKKAHGEGGRRFFGLKAWWWREERNRAKEKTESRRLGFERSRKGWRLS